MSNILEYTLTLQDKLSAKLRTIGVNSDAALNKFGALQQKVKSFDTETKHLGNSIYTLKQRIDLLQQERDLLPARGLTTIRTYNREIQKLERELNKLQTTGGMKGMFSQAISTIPFANMLTNPLVIAGGVAAASFKIGFQNDMAGVAFESLLGSKSGGKKMANEIRAYANVTPYENMPLQENAKMMLAFGLAQEKIMPSLKMIGDVAMGDANKMHLLTLAFSQTTAAGKLQGQDLLQLVNAGFNPLQEISKKTGRSLGDLRKDMEKGLITSDMVTKAFESATAQGGRFYNMTQKMGQSPMGKWSTFLDSLKNNLLKVYDILRPAVIPTLNLLTGIANGLQNTLQYVIYRFQRWSELLQGGNVLVILATSVLTGLLGAFALYNIYTGIMAAKTWLWTAAQTALNAAFMLNPIIWIVAGVIALIAAISYVIYKTDGWAKQWDSVVNFMKYSFFAFVEGVKLYFNTWINGFLIGLDIIKLGWYKFKEAVGLGDSKENQSAIAKINADVEARQKAIADGAKKVAEYSNKAKDALKWELSWNGNKKLSDIAGGLKDKLGIAPAVLPGGNGSGLGEGLGSGTGSKVTDNISAGGTRNTAININFKNMVESIVFDGNLADKRSDLEKEVTSIMARVLGMAQATS